MSSRTTPKYLSILAEFASGADINSLSAAARALDYGSGALGFFTPVLEETT